MSYTMTFDMPMREVSSTSAFKRSVKLLSRRGWDLAQLWAVVGKLAVDADRLILVGTGTHTDVFGE